MGLTWTLMDCEAAHAQHPKTFQILDKEVRSIISRGDVVKLKFVFDDGDRCEDLWVRVRETFAGRYSGGLVTQPDALKDSLKIGDKVDFEPKHVADLEKKWNGSTPSA